MNMWKMNKEILYSSAFTQRSYHLKLFNGIKESLNYAVCCFMFSHVSFVLFMKCLYVFLSNNLLWQDSPNKLANMYKQMLLAFPPFIILSLSSNPFLRGSQWQSNIVPISQKQSNMNADLEWLMYYKQNNQRRTTKIKVLSLIDQFLHQ